ncbi:DUF262 domain-containing protein [Jeotgalibacillus haloalkalitolerans]|uniref:DUF262 domain-containing HNH endonuclease family protein n=1 Tax=Jeotgalibacillus haloalkalitolerans TaxID=3104292 RepID=A0ABU5KII1_9BACL|nr:DUF262 domain-containing HNH endonuclease family protein [Jeotgalibacillus sp. HH7-29]MDZ5711002.1 DUF262 domain-containing HNH endonuclease family protein [Jeotgalibacillus sp. HH7-29]
MINNVTKAPISQLLDSERSYIYHIPKYQREYTWSKSQWENLFDDLTENDAGYFLGSIICINTITSALGDPEFEVVDGQQRLTTLSILLATLYGVLDDHRGELDEDNVSDLLQLKRKIVLKKDNNKIRVSPQIQNSNLEDYEYLMGELKILPSRKKPKNTGNRRIYKAHTYFKNRLLEEGENSVEKIKKWLLILEKVNAAIVVMIEVSTHADAYTLFESLNNRGTPLTAVDLMKNLLLAQVDQNKNSSIDVFFDQWTQILDLIGNEYKIQERFFRHYYNAFRTTINEPFKKGNESKKFPLGAIATRSTLLSIYQTMIKNDPEKFLDSIIRSARVYASILLNEEDLPAEIKEHLKDLERIQGSPSHLLLLYLFENQAKLFLDDQTLSKIVSLLVKFFVRRNLTDVPNTRDLTKIFMDIILLIEENDLIENNIYILIRDQLKRHSVDDMIFKDKLRGDIYEENAGAARFVLSKIAQQGMTKESKVNLWERNKNNKYVWTIEHIFPQGKNIPQDWVDMIADGDVEKARDHQQNLVHTLGNLTITGYNSNLSNLPFITKRDKTDRNGLYIGFKNGINLNEDLKNAEAWKPEMINKRTENLVERILILMSF